MRLTTFGDLLLDVIVQLDGALVPGDDQRAVTRTGAGGQAANVAAWAAVLGASARFVGKRGNDAAGVLVAQELAAHGVEIVGPVGGRTGVVVSFAAGGDRTMVSDRGAAPELSPDDLVDSWFDCDVLHVSGYALLREPIATAAARAAEIARRGDALISVDVSTWTLVDEAFRTRLRALAPNVVFATERELDVLGPVRATVVVKRGADGIVVGGEALPAVTTKLVDATGAGDALAAGFLIAGADAGLQAAATCCAKLGAMP